MDSFHLADREPVAKAIAAAAACGTLDELDAAERSFAEHGIDLPPDWHFTPSWRTDVPNPLMILTEKQETRDLEKGQPFTDDYGFVMREAMERFGIDDKQMHVAYGVHWFPGGEKSVNATQIATSRPFLFRRIELVRPRAIMVMGKACLEEMTLIKSQITPLLGMTMNWKRNGLVIPIYITWHAAFVERFMINVPEFDTMVEGFFERFGRPDGTPYERTAIGRNRYQAAA